MLTKAKAWTWFPPDRRLELLAAAAQADREALDQWAVANSHPGYFSESINARSLAEAAVKRARELRQQAGSVPETDVWIRIQVGKTTADNTRPPMNTCDRTRVVRNSATQPSLAGTLEQDGRNVWLYEDAAYLADTDLNADDVYALINEAANLRRLKLEKAHALVAMTKELDQRAKRQPIPQEVKVRVWQRDGGRCVECGANSELEYDHIIPLAMGGSNTDRNLQLLCARCNRRKGATLG